MMTTSCHTFTLIRVFLRRVRGSSSFPALLKGLISPIIRNSRGTSLGSSRWTCRWKVSWKIHGLSWRHMLTNDIFGQYKLLLLGKIGDLCMSHLPCLKCKITRRVKKRKKGLQQTHFMALPQGIRKSSFPLILKGSNFKNLPPYTARPGFLN